jgi:hypothetical protein
MFVSSILKSDSTHVKVSHEMLTELQNHFQFSPTFLSFLLERQHDVTTMGNFSRYIDNKLC